MQHQCNITGGTSASLETTHSASATSTHCTWHFWFEAACPTCIKPTGNSLHDIGTSIMTYNSVAAPDFLITVVCASTGGNHKCNHKWPSTRSWKHSLSTPSNKRDQLITVVFCSNLYDVKVVKNKKLINKLTMLKKTRRVAMVADSTHNVLSFWTM